MLTIWAQTLLVDESSPRSNSSNTVINESTAINPRILVFHMARKSLALCSIISIENEFSLSIISQSVIKAALRAVSYTHLRAHET